MYNDNHFTKNPYEDNGRFQIHPLSSEGLEAYLSKDSYNYHYLKSKYDPELLKQIQEEVKAEKEQNNQIKKENLNPEENNITEKQKIEEINKINNNIPLNTNNKGNNIRTKKSNEKKNINPNNKGKNNKVINRNNNNAKKIGTIGHVNNPVISTVKNDRGKLKDFQQPYHA